MWLSVPLALGLAAVPAVPPAPPLGRSIPGLHFLSDWTEPRVLPPPVNTPAWEDSAFISADGSTLYFGYIPVDYGAFAQGRLEVVEPIHDGQNGISFDIWEGHFTGGEWTIEDSSANDDDPNLHEAAIGVDRDQTTMVFARFDPEGDLYLTERDGDHWARPEKLDAPISTPCIEDNPHLSAEGDTIWFDSTRADALGSTCFTDRRSFWATHRTDGGWSVPERVVGAPNETAIRWQIFVTLDREQMYWTGWDGDCPAANCIYRAHLQDDGSYREREIVVVPTPVAEAAIGEAYALGEISFTADRSWFYFVYVFQDEPGHPEIGIGAARARRPGEPVELPPAR